MKGEGVCRQLKDEGDLGSTLYPTYDCEGQVLPPHAAPLPNIPTTFQPPCNRFPTLLEIPSYKRTSAWFILSGHRKKALSLPSTYWLCTYSADDQILRSATSTLVMDSVTWGAQQGRRMSRDRIAGERSGGYREQGRRTPENDVSDDGVAIPQCDYSRHMSLVPIFSHLRVEPEELLPLLADSHHMRSCSNEDPVPLGFGLAEGQAGDLHSTHRGAMLETSSCLQQDGGHGGHIQQLAICIW